MSSCPRTFDEAQTMKTFLKHPWPEGLSYEERFDVVRKALRQHGKVLRARSNVLSVGMGLKHQRVEGDLVRMSLVSVQRHWLRIPDKMNAKIGLSERPGLVLATRQGYLPCRSWPEPDGWEAVQGRLSDERSELALDSLPAIWHARRRPAMTRSSSPI